MARLATLNIHVLVEPMMLRHSLALCMETSALFLLLNSLWNIGQEEQGEGIKIYNHRILKSSF